MGLATASAANSVWSYGLEGGPLWRKASKASQTVSVVAMYYGLMPFVLVIGTMLFFTSEFGMVSVY